MQTGSYIWPDDEADYWLSEQECDSDDRGSLKSIYVMYLQKNLRVCVTYTLGTRRPINEVVVTWRRLMAIV